MPRRLLIANVVLAAIALGAAAYIVMEVTTPPRPAPLRPHPVAEPQASPAPPPLAVTNVPLGAYGVIASRNLFSPTRSETGGSAQARAALNLPKPTLFGVVLREGTLIAYLEDPSTKRVAGYRLGDAIAGGTVQAITADHVVLARPEGAVDVRLRDPSKPRPALPQAGAAIPGQPIVGAPPIPGTVPMPSPVTPGFVPPAVIAPPGSPGETPRSGQMPISPRRLLPPNVLRRVPPAPSDATQ